MYIVFLDVMLLHYRVGNVTCVCAWKSKNLCDSRDCTIRFIAVAWNGTHSISEVCLYFNNLINS